MAIRNRLTIDKRISESQREESSLNEYIAAEIDKDHCLELKLRCVKQIQDQRNQKQQDCESLRRQVELLQSNLIEVLSDSDEKISTELQEIQVSSNR